MQHDLRVTLVQADLHWEDACANRTAFSSRLHSLERTPDLVVLPEMFTTGFSMETETLAEPMEGPTLAWMREESAKGGFVLTGSVIIQSEGQCYNRLLWVQPDGQYSWYDKRHLFRMGKEHEHYAAGSSRTIVSLKGWRVCLQICYDLRFPVWSRNQGDYDCLLYVANWPAARRNHWNTLLRARALENQCYVIGVNRVGDDGRGVAHQGDSVLLDPLGEVNATCAAGEDCTASGTLKATYLKKLREAFPVLLDRDDFTLKHGPRNQSQGS